MLGAAAGPPSPSRTRTQPSPDRHRHPALPPACRAALTACEQGQTVYKRRKPAYHWSNITHLRAAPRWLRSHQRLRAARAVHGVPLAGRGVAEDGEPGAAPGPGHAGAPLCCAVLCCAVSCVAPEGWRGLESRALRRAPGVQAPGGHMGAGAASAGRRAAPLARERPWAATDAPPAAAGPQLLPSCPCRCPAPTCSPAAPLPRPRPPARPPAARAARRAGAARGADVARQRGAEQRRHHPQVGVCVAGWVRACRRGAQLRALQRAWLRPAGGRRVRAGGGAARALRPLPPSCRAPSVALPPRSFDGVDIGSDGTVPFRSGERISFTYLISQKVGAGGAHRSWAGRRRSVPLLG